ncbi:hypothetical protein [Flavobacterium sp.]
MLTLQDCNENPSLRLTLEELQAFQGFESIDATEAEEIISCLYQLANLVTNIND